MNLSSFTWNSIIIPNDKLKSVQINHEKVKLKLKSNETQNKLLTYTFVKNVKQYDET